MILSFRPNGNPPILIRLEYAAWTGKMGVAIYQVAMTGRAVSNRSSMSWRFGKRHPGRRRPANATECRFGHLASHPFPESC